MYIASWSTPRIALPLRPVELVEERLHQQRDVLAPLAQRRQLDGEDVEPVEEVLAQLAVADRLLRDSRSSRR